MIWVPVVAVGIVVIVVWRYMAKNYPAFLREEFGQKVHLAATGCIPLTRGLHWEETSLLFQVASALRPEGRVLPEKRPIDVYLSGLALASLDSIMNQLASSALGISAKPAPTRATEIKSTVSVILQVVQIQRIFRAGQALPVDDFTLGYLFGFSVATARARGLDAAQEIAAAGVVFSAFYSPDEAIAHLATTWNAGENRARLTAIRFGKHEAEEFVRSGQPPTGLMSEPDPRTLSRFDTDAARLQPTAPAMPKAADRVREASAICREIVSMQVDGTSPNTMRTAFARGYLAGIANGVAQSLSLNDKEAVAVALVLFKHHYGLTQGPKLMKEAFDAGERTKVFIGRREGSQDALEYQQRGVQPCRLKSHLDARGGSG